MYTKISTISIIVPFYNEGKGVDKFFKEINPILQKINNIKFSYICIDDGSKDDTLIRLKKHKNKNKSIKIIELSRNFGKEAALTAGIVNSNADAVIPIDADLQDPPELIQKLIHFWNKDYDVILAKRIDRSTDTLSKRFTAGIFYKLHNFISYINIPENVGDYRLINKNVVEAIKTLPENQRYMKGIFAWVGFKTYVVEYKRKVRSEGKSKLGLNKLLNLAIEGITSFSTAPLRIFSYIGILGIFFSIIYAIYILLNYFLLGVTTPGYNSLILSILFLGNIQLIGIGVLGEYIGKIYLESKRRPSYIIRKIFK